MFSSTAYGGGTVLFSESSSMFQQAGSEDPKKWMGTHYYNALSAMDCTKIGKTLICENYSVHLSTSI